MTDLAVIVPVYDEVQSIEQFHNELLTVLGTLGLVWRVLYVDDGSCDGSSDVLERLASLDGHISVIELSRNFGKEAAITAGLDFTDSDAVVIMDADLQHPPEMIVEFVKHWRNGTDVVFARRRNRYIESVLKRVGSRLFYKILRYSSDVDIPEDVGDFRLMSRRAVEAVRKLRERHRFMKGLFAWIGFEQKYVEYDCVSRSAGHSKWGLGQLMNFALDGVTSFSIRPLRISSIFGAVIAILSFFYGSWIIIKTLVFGDPVPGFPSLMVVILFLGGIQLLALGLIGEYIGRTFGESKRRPIYVVKDIKNPADLLIEPQLSHPNQNDAAREGQSG